MLVLLVIATVMSSAFGVCYKIAANKNCNLSMVNFWMFAGSFLGLLVYIGITRSITFDSNAVLIGVLIGAFSCVATIAFFMHMKSGQLSASWTVINLCVAFPVLASMLIWHEHPTKRQIIGFVLLLVALMLFGRREWQNRGASE